MRYHPDFARPMRGEVFVFGSNLRGVHGAGAALAALSFYGAEPGRPFGRMGQSFAIPTKCRNLQTLPLPVVRNSIDEFIDYARKHDHERFFVTRVGCGLAGYKDEQIAPYFILAPDNCSFADQWRPYLEDITIDVRPL